jgi:hypothetical protein
LNTRPVICEKESLRIEVKYPFERENLIGLLQNKPPKEQHFFGHIEEFLQTKFGKDLEEDLSCPIYLVVSKEDVGPGTHLFVIIMDEKRMYNNKKNDSISATIVHCISQVPEGELMKEELHRFLHQVLKENEN